MRFLEGPAEGVGFPQLMRAATNALERCVVRSEERVVVYTDSGGPGAMAEAIYLAAVTMGCDAVFVMAHPRFALLDPPAPAVEAMKSADVVFDLASQTWSDYAPAITEICAAGTRVLQVMLPPGQFVERQPTDELIGRVTRFGEICDAATEMRVTGPHGTDFSFQRGDLPLDVARGLVDRPGMWDSYGVFSISFTPPPASVNGTMVFNGPLSLLPQHTFITREPIRTELVDGRMVKIEDDNESASLFIRWIEQFDDDRVYQFAHVGAGVDHRVDLDIVDVTAWESLLGAVVVGVGASSGVGLQGGEYALGHMDATLMESNLFVDGRQVIEAGRFTEDSGVV
jgi:leucyl aminopeptidase (aminopeptidase T)